MPDEVRRDLIDQAIPRVGSRADDILEEAAATILPYPMGNGSPRFFGWINSPGAPLAVIAECLAAGLNPSVAGGDHAATYVEHAVLRWMRHIVGFPEDSGGLLTSGGSVANLIALAVMRHAQTGGRVRAQGIAAEPAPLIVYTSSEGHSLQKAVGSWYWPRTRRVPVDCDYRMDVGALEQQIAEDRLD